MGRLKRDKVLRTKDQKEAYDEMKTLDQLITHSTHANFKDLLK